MTTATHRTAIALAAAALVLTGCGGDDPDDGASGAESATATFTGGEVEFVGTGAIAWEAEQVSAVIDQGELDVTLVCDGSTPHNLLIEGINVVDGEDEDEILGCEGDDEVTGTVKIQPGTYQFWCDIPGHRSAGMEGELTVDQ